MSAIKTKVKYFHQLLFSPCFHSGEVDESGDKWGWAGYKAIHLTIAAAYPLESQGGKGGGCSSAAPSTLMSKKFLLHCHVGIALTELPHFKNGLGGCPPKFGRTNYEKG